MNIRFCEQTYCTILQTIYCYFFISDEVGLLFGLEIAPKGAGIFC